MPDPDIERSTSSRSTDYKGTGRDAACGGASRPGSPNRSRGNHGDKVNGVLYVDDFSFRTFSGNEQMALPYSYTIK